jgi:hypothetical protein
LLYTFVDIKRISIFAKLLYLFCLSWLNPEDYISKDELFYATNRSLNNLGNRKVINFSHFNLY